MHTFSSCGKRGLFFAAVHGLYNIIYLCMFLFVGAQSFVLPSFSQYRFFILFYLFLGVLGLQCCTGFSLVAASGGCLCTGKPKTLWDLLYCDVSLR